MILLSAINMPFALMVISVFLAGISIVLAYAGNWWTLVTSLLALILGILSGCVDLDTSSLIFWGVATAICIAITFLLPPHIRYARLGLTYFCTGALTGSVVGLVLNTQAGVIAASMTGVLLAGIAFSRVRAGKVLEFPSKQFFNYLCAKGLPLVVVFSMLGILCLHFINSGAKL